MAYQFASMVEMVAFLNGIPDSADYSALAKSEFGFDFPEKTSAFRKKYGFRYLVQGAYKGLNGNELLVYVATSVDSFVKKYPWVVESMNQFDVIEQKVEVVTLTVPSCDQTSDTEVKSGRGRKRTNFAQAGQIVYNKDYDRYYGYGENYQLIASSNDLGKLVQKMKAKYGYDAVLITPTN